MKNKIMLLLLTIIIMLNPISAFCNEYPIVFVHGVGGSASNFTLIKASLKTKGIENEMIAIDLPSKLGSNGLNGKAISKEVEKTGASKVNIVAHSAGGGNSLYYITKLDGADKVDKLITLGGLNTLVTRNAPEGVTTTTISSSTDLIVNPILSKLNGANNITITGVGHVGLLASSKVNDLIYQALTEE